MTSEYLNQPLRSEAEARKEAHDRLGKQLKDSVRLEQYRSALLFLRGYTQSLTETTSPISSLYPAMPIFKELQEHIERALS